MIYEKYKQNIENIEKNYLLVFMKRDRKAAVNADRKQVGQPDLRHVFGRTPSECYQNAEDMVGDPLWEIIGVIDIEGQRAYMPEAIAQSTTDMDFIQQQLERFNFTINHYKSLRRFHSEIAEVVFK